MEADNESWLIDTGDDIIEKMANHGMATLSEIESAIYCLWVIDYAVRNSGSLEPVSDLYPQAFEVLSTLAKSNDWSAVSIFCSHAPDPNTFCAIFYSQFDTMCHELRTCFENDSPATSHHC